MSDQLHLIPASGTRRPWVLDDSTRRRGMEGVAAARAILRESAARAVAEGRDHEDPLPAAA